MLTADIKQTFIHWATRGMLNNHCNNKDLLGIKQQRMATGFSSCFQNPGSVNSPQSHELYMAVLTTEWQISQHLKEPDSMTRDQRYVNSLRDFCACFHEVYIHGVLPS